MHLSRYVSLRTRIMATNFLMVVIPMLMLTIMGGIVYVVFYLLGSSGIGWLSYLWPERGSALTIEYSVSSLKSHIDRKRNLDFDQVERDAHLLERQGLQVVVLQQDRVIYASPMARHADEERAMRRMNETRPYIYWDDVTFRFYYRNSNHASEVYVYGRVPFTPIHDRDEVRNAEEWREILETLLWGVLALAGLVILFLGYYLAALLTRHIEESQAERERYEAARKEMIAGISHDIRTPLTLLQGYASGILDGIAKTEEQRQKYLERIRKNAKTMERLVEDLFFFSKWELGERRISLQIVNLFDFLRGFCDDEADVLRERGLDISLADTEETCFVALDVLGMRRVLCNILDNSIKYKSHDRVAVEICAECVGGMLYLTISDDGEGVDDAELARLFDTFYRVDRARTDVAKGSGLGLAIARRMVEDMGGRIRAERAKTGGLAIVIELPVVQENV